MTTKIDSPRGRAALLVCHCAGMVDLIAMPVWMDALISRYGLGPQRAGALLSVFLVAAVLMSSLLAARFTRLQHRPIAVAGFAVAAAAFAASATTTDFAVLCVLYVFGGAAVGCGLGMTHGTMGRSADPHRLFGMAGAGAGVFSIAFYAAVAALVARHGGPALFWLLAGIMAIAASAAALGFPTVPTVARASTTPTAVGGGTRSSAAALSGSSPARPTPLSLTVWLAICGVIGTAINQAIGTSFLQNIGLARDFGADHVQAVLIALGLLALFPGPLALWLQGKVSTRSVLVVGPLVQVAVVVLISHSTLFWPYAVAGALSTSVQIFMHTYAFGFIARADPSGRGAAASPAMLMTGSAVGPVLAGTLVATYGYGSLGYAAAAIGLVAAGCCAVATASGRRHNAGVAGSAGVAGVAASMPRH